MKSLAQRAASRLRRSLGGRDYDRFKGSYPDYDSALAAVGRERLAGYNHAAVAPVSYELMCRTELWDYPVLFWLERVLPDTNRIIDAGGHMGTKFRAFSSRLIFPESLDWAVCDLPEIVKQGRAQAEADGLSGISFHAGPEEIPPASVLLASGLFQYLDEDPGPYLKRFVSQPVHAVINKVATRDAEEVVTLEQFPGAEIPYRIRNRQVFERSLTDAGYTIIDQWEIASLSHTHPAFGKSTSRGYYCRLGS